MVVALFVSRAATASVDKMAGNILLLNDDIMIERFKNGAVLPSKLIEDGWFDLYCCIQEDEEYVINPNDIVLIPTGIKSAFSSRYRITLGERGSNTKSKLRLWAGKIDSGFRGEWWAALQNCNDMPVVFKTSLFYQSFDEQTVEKQIIAENKGVLVYNLSKAMCQFSVDIVPNVIIKEHNNVSDFPSARGTKQLGQSGK